MHIFWLQKNKFLYFKVKNRHQFESGRKKNYIQDCNNERGLQHQIPQTQKWVKSTSQKYLFFGLLIKLKSNNIPNGDSHHQTSRENSIELNSTNFTYGNSLPQTWNLM